MTHVHQLRKLLMGTMRCRTCALTVTRPAGMPNYTGAAMSSSTPARRARSDSSTKASRMANRPSLISSMPLQDVAPTPLVRLEAPVFEWPGEPPSMVDGEMAWYDNQWHVQHADGTVEDFPDLFQERWAEFKQQSTIPW